MEGSAPSKTKEETAHCVRPRDQGALVALGNFAHTDQKKDDGSKPGPTGTLWGNCSGQAALKREQRERFETNLCENRGMGKDGETGHSRYKHSPWKIRNDGMPVGYLGQIDLRREQCSMYTRY
jgi:hypothetical protein